MINFTQRIKFVLVIALSFVGMTAQAIDKITLGELTYNVLSTEEVQFSTTEHSAYSDEIIDWTAAYAAACQALGAESVSVNDFVRVDPIGNAFAFNINDGWCSADGMVDGCGWGTALGICVKAWNFDASGEVVIDGIASYFGCYDEEHSVGDEAHAYFAVVKGTDAVVIDFHITFSEKVRHYLSTLNVVGEQSVVIERTTIQGYEPSRAVFKPALVAEALGIETGKLASNLQKMLFMQKCDQDLFLTDELSQDFTAGAPGWWMARTIYPIGHEKVGEDSPYLGACGYGNNALLFAEAFHFNEALDTLMANVGQFPGNLQEGDDLFANIYVISDDKAYKLQIEVKVSAAATTGLNGMTEVGSKMVTIQQYPTTDFSTTSYSVNLPSIASALGCATNDVAYKALSNEDTFYPGATTTNAIGGYWFTKDGYVCNYATGEDGAYFFIDPVSAGDYDSFIIGQMPGNFAVGDSAVVDQFFIHGDQYYRVHLHMDIIEKPAIEDDQWTIVANRSVVVKQTPNGGYEWSAQTGIIKAQDLTNLLGTTSPVLYGEVVDENGAVSKTDEYNINERPGFWLTADGYASPWGNNTTWAITCLPSVTGAANGDWGFKCMQFAGFGELGNSYTGTFYLLNPENYKCIKVTLTNTVVDVVTESEIIGEQDVVLPVTLNGESIDFDLAPLAEKFGITTDELYSGNFLHGLTGGAVTVTTGLQFDQKGNIDESGNGAFGLMWESEESLFVYSNMDEEVADDWTTSADVYFDVEGKQYILHIRFVSKVAYDEYITAVSTVKADKQNAIIFDLSGRQVQKAQKGIFIQNGKKVVK